MDTCPFTSKGCTAPEKVCFLYIKLDDFEGCSLNLANKALQDFKENFILPAAKKLDDLRPTPPPKDSLKLMLELDRFFIRRRESESR